MAKPFLTMDNALWSDAQGNKLTEEAGLIYDDPFMQAMNVSRIKGNLAGLAKHDATVAVFLAAIGRPGFNLDIGDMLVALISVLSEEKRGCQKNLELCKRREVGQNEL